MAGGSSDLLPPGVGCAACPLIEEERDCRVATKRLCVEHIVVRDKTWNSHLFPTAAGVGELGCREMQHWVWQSHRDGDEYVKVFFSYTASSGASTGNTGGVFTQ